MCDQITVWVKNTLIPVIINRTKSEFPASNDVFLKELTIKQFENDGAFMMTICYKLNIVLDIDGKLHRLSVFLKVRLNTDLSELVAWLDR